MVKEPESFGDDELEDQGADDATYPKDPLVEKLKNAGKISVDAVNKVIDTEVYSASDEKLDSLLKGENSGTEHHKS